MRKWFNEVDQDDVKFVASAVIMLMLFVAFVLIWYLEYRGPV